MTSADEMRGLALRRLEQAVTEPDPVAAERLRVEALVMSNLAVATELARVSDAVLGVKSALEDIDGHGVGSHLHYLVDHVERLAKRS